MARRRPTTGEAQSGYGLDSPPELQTLRVLAVLHGRVPNYLGAHVPPPEFPGPGAYLDWVCAEMLPKVRNDDLHADFAAMLRSHEENIACTNTLLGQTP